MWASATGASATSRGRIRVFDLDRGPTLIERGSLVGPAGGRGFGSWMDVDRAGDIVAGAPTFTSIEALVNSMGVAIPDDWSPVGEVILDTALPFTFFEFAVEGRALGGSFEDLDGDPFDDVMLSSRKDGELRVFGGAPGRF